MKYFVFATEAEAIAASQEIYAGLVRERAALFNGLLEKWNGGIVPVDVTDWPDTSLTGDKFPIYGYRASDNKMMKESGHTIAWAVPRQIQNGSWVFPSPNDEGVDPSDDWWISPNETA